MFAPFNKVRNAALAVAAVALMVTACEPADSSTPVSKDTGGVIQNIIPGGSSGVMDNEITRQAPKHNPTYEPGNEPHNRTDEVFAIKNQTCPTEDEVFEFIKERSDHPQLNMSPISGDIPVSPHYITPGIDHYTFETVVGTMNPKCLPSLDGSLEYKPGTGSKKLQDAWFNYQNVFTTALGTQDRPVEGTDSLEYGWWMTDDRVRSENAQDVIWAYSDSIQMLGIISALMGGPIFQFYHNDVPHLTNPEVFDRSMGNQAWSNWYTVSRHTVGFRILGGEEAIQRYNEEYAEKFYELNGITMSEWEDRAVESIRSGEDMGIDIIHPESPMDMDLRDYVDW